MEHETPMSEPQPSGAFGHPGAAPLREQSSDDSPGFDDQQEYSAAIEAAAGDDGVLPPRAAEAVRREPLVQQDQRPAGEG